MQRLHNCWNSRDSWGYSKFFESLQQDIAFESSLWNKLLRPSQDNQGKHKQGPDKQWLRDILRVQALSSGYRDPLD